jgi:hypothetical protein
MLQGIGTILGALAVITAALVGGNTFRAWRRQQLVQRHMVLAERIMTAIFTAREDFAAARSPLMTGAELEAAEKELVANGFDFTKMELPQADQLRRGQAYLTRVNRSIETWKELESSKASAYAFFGGDLPKQIDRILRQVHVFRIDAQEYANDDGADAEFSRSLRRTLSSSRGRGDSDDVAAEVEDAIAAIEERLRPFLQEVANETQKALTEALKSGIWLIGRLPF